MLTSFRLISWISLRPWKWGQDQIYGCGGPRWNEHVEAPISNNTFKLWSIFILSLFLILTKKYKPTFRDFWDENVQIKSVDSVSVLWGPGATALVLPPYIQLNTSLRNTCKFLTEYKGSHCSKIVLLRYITPQFVPHRKHNISPLQRPAGLCLLWEPYGTHKYTLCGQNVYFLNVNAGGAYSTRHGL
jgi:hypothetical protein